MHKSLLLYILFLALPANGQPTDAKRTVTGTVSDTLRELLPGATVLNRQTKVGTLTDMDGRYAIAARPTDTLEFQFAGYVTKRIRAQETTINVILQEQRQVLETILPYEQKVGKKYPTQAKLTRRDLRNTDNPRYEFRKNARAGKIIIFAFGLQDYNLPPGDLAFQQKYQVLYSMTGHYNQRFLVQYNWLAFRYLRRKFGKAWRTEVRKDAVGLAIYPERS